MSKKKVLIVLVGGTICTTIQNDMRSLDTDAAKVMLVNGFLKSDSPCVNDVTFEIGKNFDTLSENMTISLWNDMIAYFREIRFKDFDGIIIAHGTDTLAYSSSIFSLLLHGTGVPIFFVSSNSPLEFGDIKANGMANFRTAVECIYYNIYPGVYVPYRNPSDGKMYLHRGARLIQSMNYTEDFYSVGSINLNLLNLTQESMREINQQLAVDCFYPENPLLFSMNGNYLSDCVLKIVPYVGLNYGAYDYSQFKAVLHGSYHSGTACVERYKDKPSYSNHSILYLIDKCAQAGVDVYITPVKNEGDIYDTVPIMMHHRYAGKSIVALYGTTTEMAFAKLILIYSNESSQETIKKILSINYCGEKWC